MAPPTISEHLSPNWTLPVRQCRILLGLSRGRLSTLVALSGLAGYVFAGQQWRLPGLWLFLGIWLLAAGCSALNQWQEREIDARMLRTSSRPLPSGQLGANSALLLAAASLLTGMLLLTLLHQGLPLLLAGLSVLWYNGVYTYLKRLTPFAVLPGALCGALPPLIGWSAAGGELTAYPAVILAGTLLLWQPPHFWLLACRHRRDLECCGLPHIFERIEPRLLFRINSCWLAALSVCYLLFPLLGLLQRQAVCLLFLSGLAALLLAIGQELRKGTERADPGRLFRLLNLSMALLLLCLLLDNLG